MRSPDLHTLGGVTTHKHPYLDLNLCHHFANDPTFTKIFDSQKPVTRPPVPLAFGNSFLTKCKEKVQRSISLMIFMVVTGIGWGLNLHCVPSETLRIVKSYGSFGTSNKSVGEMKPLVRQTSEFRERWCYNNRRIVHPTYTNHQLLKRPGYPEIRWRNVYNLSKHWSKFETSFRMFTINK